MKHQTFYSYLLKTDLRLNMKPIHICTTCKGANSVTLSRVYSNESSIRKVVSKLTDYHILHNCLKELSHGQLILKKLASFFKFVSRNPS